MDAQLIEQLDRRRFKLIVWKTVNYGLAVPFLSLVLLRPEGILLYLWCAGIVLMGISQFAADSKLSGLEKDIRTNPAICAALDNELVQYYKNLSYKWSFYVLMAAVFILLGLSPLFKVPYLPFLILIYIGMITPKVLRLIMMRK